MARYIRKSVADFLEKMPKEMKTPKHWHKFVNEKSKKYNLIIKHGKEYECTNCGKYFYSEQVEGCTEVCPFCDNEYTVRRSNLKNYYRLFDLAVIDNVDNKLVLRFFEIERRYNPATRRLDNDIVEYARIVPDLDVELVNNCFYKFMDIERVYHFRKIEKWRVFTGMYGISHCYESVYLDNINEKTKGTIYQYCNLQEIIEHEQNKEKKLIDIIRKRRLNILALLEKAKNPSFEFLVKAKLYKLALTNPEQFNVKGSFEKRFGVTKKYYNFMKKHDISFEELTILKLINRPNMRIIRDLLKLSDNSVNELLDISKYTNILKVKDYAKKQKDFTMINYKDYINNLLRLNIPLTNKNLFPKNFDEEHNQILQKIDIIESAEIVKKIKQRSETLEKNIYKNEKFFIRPAHSLEDMRKESEQQDNCVYKNYSKEYANGETDIYFLRTLKNPNKSLVTVEVLNKKIRQKYQKRNTPTTKEQDNFLKLWEKNIIQKAA